jgi:hypothetical protein
MVAAIIGVAVLVAGVVLAGVLLFRGYQAGKQVVVEQIELHKLEESRRAAADAVNRPVELKEGNLPEYATYQPGLPLTREAYLAWKVDRDATSLVRETFRTKIEGAEVTWQLRTGDLRDEGSLITGSFYLPYVLQPDDGRGGEAGVEPVRCEFAASERESLLDLRRDQPALIRGRLSLKSGELVLHDARKAGDDVEKE